MRALSFGFAAGPSLDMYDVRGSWKSCLHMFRKTTL